MTESWWAFVFLCLQHAYTATDITNPPSYKGTEVFINVWEPVVVEPHDFSLAQLWFLNTGLAYPSSSSSSLLNTIEAGWQVYPEFYGDDQPRLFIYWTVNVSTMIICTMFISSIYSKTLLRACGLVYLIVTYS
jgi:hypothetical protein